MASKEELIQKATSLAIPLTGQETKPELEELIVQATIDQQNGAEAQSKGTENMSEEEKMVPLSVVKEMIAEAMARQDEKSKPVKVKKVTEHHAHVWRLNGKWIVDFADRNYDYANKKIIDPYIKEKIHAYQIFNANKREFEAWIKVIYEDGSTEELPLNRYVERRVLVYCPIIKREQVDKSYVIGEIERKKETGDVMKGTGIMIDQAVEMHQEIFHVRTPEGKNLILPDYVIA